MSEAAAAFLVRKGRMLTPASRTCYRLTRLRTGKTIFLSDGELLIGVLALVVRCVTIPIFAMVDLLLWPVFRFTIARGPWWVVRVTFDGPDARFDRVLEVPTREEAEQQRRTMEERRRS